MELANKEWKEFSLKDLFSVDRGTRLIIRDRVDGKYPFVTAGFTNQGVVGYISNDSNKTFRDSITIDMFGNTFFRFYEFKCDDNIHVLQSNNLSPYSAKFIKTSISKSMSDIYSYGKQFRLKSFYLLKILLPVNSKGKPDYAFMENYIRQKETELLKQYEKQVSEFESVVPLSEKEWREFKIGDKDIFIVKTGAQVPKQNLKKGNTPRISATENNNGITDFHSFNTHKNYREIENFISISFLGSVFYHTYKASLDMKIHSIQLKQTKLNRYIAEFMIIALRRMASIYSYGNQLSSTDILNKKIFLPVTTDNTPDYTYMENYMKVKEQEKKQKYLKYLRNRK